MHCIRIYKAYILLYFVSSWVYGAMGNEEVVVSRLIHVLHIFQSCVTHTPATGGRLMVYRRGMIDRVLIAPIQAPRRTHRVQTRHA